MFSILSVALTIYNFGFDDIVLSLHQGRGT